MTWWPVLVAVGGLVGIGIWLRRKSDRDVSQAWVIDHVRREQGRGIDQACVQSWPIQRSK